MFFKMSNFKVTKALIEAYVNNGFTVRMMAEDITKQSGVKCSDAVVRAACKTYGINLKLKKMPSHFVFEDLDVVGGTVPTKTITELVQAIVSADLTPVGAEVVYDAVTAETPVEEVV